MKKLLIIVTYLIFLMLIIAPFSRIFLGAFEKGWGPFLAALLRPEAVHALMISLIIVTIVTIMNALVGVLLSLELVRGHWLPRWLKNLLQAIVDLPFAVSPIIAGLMFILLLGPDTILGAFFEQRLGIQIVFALPGMILATLFVTFPLMIREVVPILYEIGDAQEEASATLGASSWRTFWMVTWPLIKWPVIYGAVLTMARALGEFGAVLVVSGNIINETQTATTLVYQDADNFDLLSANSMAFILGFISIVVLLILEWIKHRKEEQA